MGAPENTRDTALVVPPLDAPWPMFQQKANLAGRSNAPGIADGVVRWRTTTRGPIETSPIVDRHGTIYVGSTDRTLYAVHPDGSASWSFAAHAAITGSPVVARHGSIYFAATELESAPTRAAGAAVYALNSDGTSRWTYAMPDDALMAPLSLSPDGVLYVPGDSTLYALGEDGTLAWKSATLNGQGPGRSCVAIGPDGTRYIAAFDETVRAFDVAGNQRWAYRTSDGFYGSPAVGDDGTIYVGGVGILAIRADGTLAWRAGANGISTSIAIASDGTIIAGDASGVLHAIEPNGAEKWARRLSAANQPVLGSPVIAGDGTIYVGCFDGNLYAVSASGKLAWSVATGGPIYSAPAIGIDGTIYVGSEDGSLYAIGR